MTISDKVICNSKPLLNIKLLLKHPQIILNTDGGNSTANWTLAVSQA
jgi:hypothetical protein